MREHRITYLYEVISDETGRESMDITRRKFVKATAIGLATAAAGGSLSLLAACTSEEAGKASGDSQTYSAVCRFCGCGCGVLCEVKDGKLISVTGDPDNQ